ncbi:hypothetical protein A2773_02315 [Candidatus Gottesmanbacteria bacterium RIFCSPHIGHO2_01_FULL_39_10]|uniref:Cytosine permease n=1 Tax=Candidatus Gottesmanbacteria bacterium RIFCSPHIGHO2_01_FULL_39_10 TaxID=1798375 RepID=A0A1F5ZQ68_9BACT|nr:MAG: hypothetical protein A2773_02315 [Candidatus Gottesmanbacteria bacterium RIFCSPHIGHO2_01_FULL_39_10]
MEYTAFQKVPDNKRTFSFWDQLVFWFSACSLPAAWTYGALMAGWQGIAGALVLIVVVNTLSFIPWAFLGRIAAETGGSSMAIVRPTFGIKGSVVPSIFYLILGIGWGAVNVFIGAIALSFIFKLWLGFPSYIDSGNTFYMVAYIILVCALQSFFAIRGSEWIKRLQWIATIFFIFLGLYQTYVVFQHWGAAELMKWRPDKMLTSSIGPFVYPITFALLVDLLIAYNWTWEFIGDFSRFAKNKTAGTWGPFLGATLAQYWWFLVGALAVVYLTKTTGLYNPLLADPSSTTVALGFGWLAALIILFATVTTNAGNIYASSLGLSNILREKKHDLFGLMLIVSGAVAVFSLTPLLSKDFVGFFIFFLDFLGAIVVPLWIVTLVDYFWVKRGKYSDDIFKQTGGKYWYQKGWNWPGIVTLLSGTVFYWVVAYALPNFRIAYTAAIPTMIYVGVVYVIWMKRK